MTFRIRYMNARNIAHSVQTTYNPDNIQSTAVQACPVAPIVEKPKIIASAPLVTVNKQTAQTAILVKPVNKAATQFEPTVINKTMLTSLICEKLNIDTIDSLKGCTGHTGPSGVGIAGHTGTIGNTGARGHTGPIGHSSGITGPTGYTGPIGIAGTNGHTGLRGHTGIIGHTGPQGETGPACKCLNSNSQSNLVVYVDNIRALESTADVHKNPEGSLALLKNVLIGSKHLEVSAVSHIEPTYDCVVIPYTGAYKITFGGFFSANSVSQARLRVLRNYKAVYDRSFCDGISLQHFNTFNVLWDDFQIGDKCYFYMRENITKKNNYIDIVSNSTVNTDDANTRGYLVIEKL